MRLFSKPRKKSVVKTVSKAFKDAKKQAEKEQRAAERAQAAAMRAAEKARYPYRQIGSRVETGEPFPLGVKGCTEIHTVYRGGKDVKCYGLDAPDIYDALSVSIDQVNDLLDEASKLSGHEFGVITNIMGTPGDELWGYARIEYNPLTKNGSVNKTPVKLIIETSNVLCSPDSHSGFIKYDTDGNIKTVEIKNWEHPHAVRKMKASRVRGSLQVKEVTESVYGNDKVLYTA